jgi:rhamnulokinase
VAESLRLAAVDLGAESGRVVLGCFDGETVTLDVRHRFANRPLWLPDGLHWNLPDLFAQTLNGLCAATDSGPLDGIGIDAWGCDYALLDGEHRMLGLPYSYRDERTSAENMDRAHIRVGRAELYRRTGIQTMPINTVYQLSAEAGGAAARAAEHIALVPDLIGLWLTGTLANELTIASTTGLLEARGRHWATDLVARLGLPPAPFGGEVVAPGFELGPVLNGHAADAGAAVGTPVRAVGGHDTASAFAAAPRDRDGCGDPVLRDVVAARRRACRAELGPDAEAFNLTNERGVGDTVRLLRNVMGLWLVQECRRVWRAEGAEHDYGDLVSLAGEARADVPLFDPDHDSLLHGGDMPARIAELCSRAGQPAPAGAGELVRSILVSLACKYRLVLEQLEQVTDRRIDTVHVVGGGARNELLCRLTADVCAREVVTGPAEATALGNVLVQVLALGELADLADLRRVAERSVASRRYEPRASAAAAAAETYPRFLETTGLSATRAARAPVA